jgi:hypothetical protein
VEPPDLRVLSVGLPLATPLDARATADVGSAATDRRVRSASAAQLVVPGATSHDVVATATQHQVPTSPSPDDVVPPSPQMTSLRAVPISSSFPDVPTTWLRGSSSNPGQTAQVLVTWSLQLPAGAPARPSDPFSQAHGPLGGSPTGEQAPGSSCDSVGARAEPHQLPRDSPYDVRTRQEGVKAASYGRRLSAGAEPGSAWWLEDRRFHASSIPGERSHLEVDEHAESSRLRVLEKRMFGAPL